MRAAIDDIQSALAAAAVDAWLLYDFRGSNDLAIRVLGLDPEAHRSRRWLYVIPARGEPWGLVHAIEPGALESVPGARRTYASQASWDSGVAEAVSGHGVVALEVSLDGSNPYVAKVDSGVVDAVRGHGVEVVSSADLVQAFAARWPEAAYPLYRRAAEALIDIKDAAFREVFAALDAGREITEADVARSIMARMGAAGLDPQEPIVGAGANAGNPHHTPLSAPTRIIHADEPLLIDLFARVAGDASAATADFTFMGWTGSTPSDEFMGLWHTVTAARDSALELVRNRVRARTRVEGWEIDAAARAVIDRAGHGAAFVHRTGHSLGRDTHDIGMNADGLEMHDRRAAMAGTAFTIEPGIYLDHVGLRTEINVLVHDDDVEVWADPPQSVVTTRGR